MKSPSALIAILLACPCCCAQARQPAPSQHPIISTTSALVLADVITLNMKTGLPDKDLKKDDFLVFDNGKPMQIETFDTGAHFDTRPVDLWLIVICNEGAAIPEFPVENQTRDKRSASFVGKENLFRPGLDHLDKNDRVGVAHWCDNGDAAIDLSPSQDRDLAISTLARTLRPIDFMVTERPQLRDGELACQRMLHLVLENAHEANPQPLPVLVFLQSDWTGMPRDELEELVTGILETSGIIFGIKDQGVPDAPALRFEQGAIFHYLAAETGGQYFAASPNHYSAALSEILLQLHFRYQLGFRPPALDGKVHQLTIKLTKDAQQRHKSVRLRSRPEYVPKP